MLAISSCFLSPLAIPPSKFSKTRVSEGFFFPLNMFLFKKKSLLTLDELGAIVL